MSTKKLIYNRLWTLRIDEVTRKTCISIFEPFEFDQYLNLKYCCDDVKL